jgi:hypothetical protein
MLSVCRRPQLFKPFVAAGRASSNRAFARINDSYCAEQTTERGKKQPRNRQIRLSGEYPVCFHCEKAEEQHQDAHRMNDF